MLGIVFTVLSAASFGLTSATIRRGMVHVTALQGLYITIFAGLPMFLVAALATGELFDWREFSSNEYALLAVAGVVQLGVGRYSNYRAVGLLGVNRAAPIIGMSTLVSVAVAVVALNEEVTVLMGVGIVLMMIGPSITMMGERERTPVQSGGSGTGPIGAVALDRASYVEGIAFSILAAVAWGVSPVLMRAAVDDNGLGVLGGLVTYVATSAVLLLTFAVPGQLASTLKMDRTGGWWFLFSAVNSFVANIFRFMALAIN